MPSMRAPQTIRVEVEVGGQAMIRVIDDVMNDA